MAHYYDTHTHLNAEQLYPEREKYLQMFIDAGGKWLVNVSASEEYLYRGIEIAQKVKEKNSDCLVKTTVGRHPYEVDAGIITQGNIHKKMQLLKDLYTQHREHIVGIGECGIDLHYENKDTSLVLQQEVFEQHCDLAQELDLPVVIHSRDGFPETFDVLKKYPDLTIYFHCRWYGPDEYRQLASTFSKLFIGFCCNSMYKKAENIRDTLGIISREQIVLETDAPYLSPQHIRWELNHPANVRFLYESVSEFLSWNLADLVEKVEGNVKRLYKV